MTLRAYTTHWCPDCLRAKSFLREHQVPFDEIDIERDESAVRLVMEQNGGKKRVPTFEVDGAFYGNPSIPELARIVGVDL